MKNNQRKCHLGDYGDEAVILYGSSKHISLGLAKLLNFKNPLDCLQRYCFIIGQQDMQYQSTYILRTHYAACYPRFLINDS